MIALSDFPRTYIRIPCRDNQNRSTGCLRQENKSDSECVNHGRSPTPLAQSSTVSAALGLSVTHSLHGSPAQNSRVPSCPSISNSRLAQKASLRAESKSASSLP